MDEFDAVDIVYNAVASCGHRCYDLQGQIGSRLDQ